MEDTVEGAAEKMGASPLSPVQIAKKAEKQMRREKMVGAGKQYAPTLYTVLVSQDDDERLFGYYPTLAGQTETYLSAKAAEHGLVMDGQPLVRFIADDGLKRGKFEVIAEMVAAPIVSQLRQEEMERYGIAPAQGRAQGARGMRGGYVDPQPMQQPRGYSRNEPANGWDDGYGAPEPSGFAGAAGAVGAAGIGAAGAVAGMGAAPDAYGAEPQTMVFGQALPTQEQPAQRPPKTSKPTSTTSRTTAPSRSPAGT